MCGSEYFLISQSLKSQLKCVWVRVKVTLNIGQLLLNPEDALALGVGQSAQLEIGGRHYAAAASADVPKGALLVPQGLPETAELPLTGQAIAIDKVIHG